jgi:hypothetical protein
MTLGDTTLVSEQTGNLKHFAQLTPRRVEGGVLVTVGNSFSGHSFPTGVTDIREAWVEVQALDASGKLLATFGGPDADGLIPPTAARLGRDIADSQGNILYDHQLSLVTRVPPGEAQALFVPVPDALPSGTASLQAALQFRNVRTTYFRDATKDPTAVPPTTTLVSAVVP